MRSTPAPRRIDVALRERRAASLIVVADDGMRHVRRRPDAGDRAPRHLEARPMTISSNIATLGFRGEALPSIGAVARLSITSRRRGSADGLGDCGRGRRSIAAWRPRRWREGTRVEVRDLFYATPARLKFLKRAAHRGGSRSSMSSSAWRWRTRASPSPLPTASDAAALAGGLGRGRDGTARPARRGDGPRFRRQRAGDCRRAGTASAHRLCRAADTTTAAPPARSICSSMAGRCVTGCCSARCAAPIRISSPATATRAGAVP